MSTLLHDSLRSLIDQACDLYADGPYAARLEGLRQRLDAPLRVAIAGRLKAGKSTLLNALVGECVATTDAGECTRLVTWYRHGQLRRVWCHDRAGTVSQLRFEMDDATAVDLAGRNPDTIDHLVVEVPSDSLANLTLIDTPGIGSLSSEVSARAEDYLLGRDDHPVDAVVFLLRHVQAGDVQLLEAIRDGGISGGSSVATLALLSRADEVGGGRIDSLQVAKRVAHRYGRDPAVKALANDVLPVAGLLAQSSTVLRQADILALRDLAGSPRTERALLSVDEFLDPDIDLGPPVEQRRQLLQALGLFGVRLAVRELQRSSELGPTALAESLMEHSGLPELRRRLLLQFSQRSDVLKARTILAAIRATVMESPVGGSSELLHRAEQLELTSPEFQEIKTIERLRDGSDEVPDAVAVRLERVLGRAGADVRSRLGLPADLGAAPTADALKAERSYWLTLSSDPMESSLTRELAGMAVRSLDLLQSGTGSDVV